MASSLSFKQLLVALGVLGGLIGLAIPRTAQAEKTGFTCEKPNSCGPGSFSCVTTCDKWGCSCSIS
jgi:hypothetical protein